MTIALNKGKKRVYIFPSSYLVDKKISNDSLMDLKWSPFYMNHYCNKKCVSYKGGKTILKRKKKLLYMGASAFLSQMMEHKK